MKTIVSIINIVAWIGAIVFVILPMIDLTSADSTLHGEALGQECGILIIKFILFAVLIGVTSVLKSLFKK